MGFIGFIIAATILVAVMSVLFSSMGNASRKSQAVGNMERLMKEKNITDYEWRQFEDSQILLNDRSKGMIWVIQHDGEVSRHYRNVTDIELIIDDSVEYQSSLSSAAGRAVVGGVLFGGVGAVVGGVTGKKNGKKIVHKVELVLSYNNDIIPYSSITLLNDKNGVDTESDSYNDAYSYGMYWSKLITALSSNR